MIRQAPSTGTGPTTSPAAAPWRWARSSSGRSSSVARVSTTATPALAAISSIGRPHSSRAVASSASCTCCRSKRVQATACSAMIAALRSGEAASRAAKSLMAWSSASTVGHPVPPRARWAVSERARRQADRSKVPDVIASIHTALSGSGATSPTTWRRRCESQSATVTPQRANHCLGLVGREQSAVVPQRGGALLHGPAHGLLVEGGPPCPARPLVRAHPTSPHALAASITAAQSTASPSIVKTVRDRTSTGVTRATGHGRRGPRTGGRAWRR